MKYCSNCNTECPDDNNFCFNCGAKLNVQEEPVKAACEAAPENTPQEPENTVQAEVAPDVAAACAAVQSVLNTENSDAEKPIEAVEFKPVEASCEAAPEAESIAEAEKKAGDDTKAQEDTKAMEDTSTIEAAAVCAASCEAAPCAEAAFAAEKADINPCGAEAVRPSEKSCADVSGTAFQSKAPKTAASQEKACAGKAADTARMQYYPYSAKAKSYSVLAFVFGLFSILFWWIPLVNIFTLILAIVGIVFASKSRREYKFALAMAGKILCIIALVLSLLYLIAWVIVFVIGFSYIAATFNLFGELINFFNYLPEMIGGSIL